MPRRICRQAPSHLVGVQEEGFFPFSFIWFWILAHFLFVLICQNSKNSKWFEFLKVLRFVFSCQNSPLQQLTFAKTRPVLKQKKLWKFEFLARKFKSIWILAGFEVYFDLPKFALFNSWLFQHFFAIFNSMKCRLIVFGAKIQML